MKRRLLFGLLVLLPVSLVCQNTSAAKPRSGKTSFSGKSDSKPETAFFLDCPATKGCQSFKQLWKANDKQVRKASWVCFPITYDGGDVTLADDFTLLTINDYFFYMSVFNNGVSITDEVALKVDPDAGYKRKWFDPLPQDPALTVLENNDELFLVRETSAPTPTQMKMTLRLSTGRYCTMNRLPDGQRVESGVCVVLKPTLTTKPESDSHPI